MPQDIYFNAEDFVNKLIDSDSTYASQVTDGHHSTTIRKALEKRGAKPIKSRSQCKVASSEFDLAINGKRFNVIESNYMGRFTEVTMTAT